MLPHTITQIFLDIENDLQERLEYNHPITRTMYEKLIAYDGTIKPYKNGTDYTVRIGKYEITINPYTFKVCEIINEPSETETASTPFRLAKIYNASAIRDRWIFEINNGNSIHYYATSAYTYTKHPYCITEEDYFQNSTLYDLGSMELDDMLKIEEFRVAVMRCVEQYTRGVLWNN